MIVASYIFQYNFLFVGFSFVQKLSSMKYKIIKKKRDVNVCIPHIEGISEGTANIKISYQNIF